MSYSKQFLRQRRLEAMGKKALTVKEVVTGIIMMLFALGVLYLGAVVLPLSLN